MRQRTRVSAYGLITHGSKILLSKLNRGPNAGMYNLPGGGLDFGEKPEEALLREVNEEAGIQLPNYLMHTVLSETYEWDLSGEVEQLHLIGIIFISELDSLYQVKQTRDAKEGGSCDGCQWFDIDECDKSFVTSMALKAMELL